MAKGPFGFETTVIPVLRKDGTVHFQYFSKTMSERLCPWTVAFLWVVSVAVGVLALSL